MYLDNLTKEAFGGKIFVLFLARPSRTELNASYVDEFTLPSKCDKSFAQQFGYKLVLPKVTPQMLQSLDAFGITFIIHWTLYYSKQIDMDPRPPT